MDIIKMGSNIHDGHFYLGLDLATQVLSWSRDIELAAVSADGLDTPQIYVASDLVGYDDDGDRVGLGLAASPIVTIDDVDVVTFLLAQATDDSGQDPDANWNAVFQPIYSAGGFFGAPAFYPGGTTTLTFANGTSIPYSNSAIVSANLTGIRTGQDMYDTFCWTDTSTPAESAPSTTETPGPDPTTTKIPKAAPTVYGYPYPAIKHSADSISGYYLNDTNYKDVAVLRVADFEASGVRFNEATYQEEFQMVEQKFFEACTQLGKKKLIIDLQGNPGGFIDSGTDFFAQLFPFDAPNSKSNMRATVGMDIIIEQASANVSSAERTPSKQDDIDAEYDWVPFAWQSVVTPDMKDFTSTKQFSGPETLHGGKFTKFFQNNYTNSDSSDYQGTGIIITGTNNRTGFHQPFNPGNIVVLYDGVCHSTCTVVSEYLKNYAGVQFITVGGRPRTGAMQAVGGVKGTQVFTWDDMLYPAWQLFQDAPQSVLRQADGTMWQNWTDYAWQRTLASSVNGRNAFRNGDKTNTPLQFVYEAADCRLWYTREMLYDPVFLWNRVAEVAFVDRKGKQLNSKWCVKDSTGHSTSISGGWKSGTLGSQNPPDGAKATSKGWKLTGKKLGPVSGVKIGNTGKGDSSKMVDGVKEACRQYSGDRWLVKVMCGSITG